MSQTSTSYNVIVTLIYIEQKKVTRKGTVKSTAKP